MSLSLFSFSRALNLGLCPQCILSLHETGQDEALFQAESQSLAILTEIRECYDNEYIAQAVQRCNNDNSNQNAAEDAEKLDERFTHYMSMYAGDSNGSKPPMCPCCHGHFSENVAKRLAATAYASLRQLDLPGAKVEVKVKLPRSLELMRLMTLDMLVGDGNQYLHLMFLTE